MAALVGIGCLSLIPVSANAVTFPTTCHDRTHNFSIGVPDGWWVHPSDVTRGIDACARFGPGPFELAPNNEGILVGEAISVGWIINSCVGFVAPPKSNEALEVAGRPARRIETTPTDGPGSPEHAMTFYWIQLSEEECSRDSSFLAVTTSAAAGHYSRNVAVLDQLVQTITLGIPDSAMPRAESRPAELVLVGWLLVASAAMSAAVLYSQPRLRK